MKASFQERISSYLPTSSVTYFLFPDALSYNMQIINNIGLKFQQNMLKVDTNIVLYQVLFWSKSLIL